jgi:Protein  of unknown function (DUF3018)
MMTRQTSSRTGRPATKAGTTESTANKFKKYRASKQQRGLKLVRMWLPDPKSVAFRRSIRRQCLALRGTPEDRDALDFIEANNEAENWWQ